MRSSSREPCLRARLPLSLPLLTHGFFWPLIADGFASVCRVKTNIRREEFGSYVLQAHVPLSEQGAFQMEELLTFPGHVGQVGTTARPRKKTRSPQCRTALVERVRRENAR
jgi:hypothetical protein